MKRLVAALFCIASAPTFGEPLGACLPLDDTLVSLSGQVVLRTFPGPPNYESISAGDRAETQLILVLDNPICASGPGVTGSAAKPMRVDGVREVTLVPTDAVPKIDEIGAHYLVRGSLFEAHTGHHRTPLLLELKSAIVG